jgi:Putative peptidoglycan binding domain
MKTLTLLTILTLGTTAIADHRIHFSSSRNCRSYSAPRIRYTQPCYSRSHYSYRPTYYRSAPSVFRSGFFLRPAVSVTYSSVSPRYYGGYSSSYRSSSSIEAEVQSALKRRGYYRGYVDGDIGPESRAAIRAWQYERGLAVTGRVDGALLRSLGI